MAKRRGYVVYRGPSELDGKPIIVVATGFREKSSNIKTGNMIQTWILREDISPLEAVHSGEDASICGQCPHRGVIIEREDGSPKNVLRTCYVLSFKAPLAVWGAYVRGVYEDVSRDPERIIQLFAGRTVRLGAYGDPAAAPEKTWAWLTLRAKKWAGYTHGWRSLGPKSLLRTLVMASVDSEVEADVAQALGWRTFRIGARTREGEITCPASEEGGKKTTCTDCTLCQGAYRQAKNIVIQPHGNRIRTVKKASRRKLVVV